MAEDELLLEQPNFHFQNHYLKDFFYRKKSKTASYHRHNLRFPIFVKKAFKKMKTIFSRENTPSSSYFLIFPILQISEFLPKPLN